MRIAFDAQPLIDSQKTGVGYCEAGLVREMLKRYPQHQYQMKFFCFRHSGEKKQRLEPFLALGSSLRPCAFMPGSLYRMLSAFLPIPYRWFLGKNPGITHFFNFIVPPGVGGKKICTVHDMAYRAFSDTVRWKTRVMLDLSLKASCRRADRIITVSRFSKEELVRYLKIPEDKIQVVPNGVDLSVFHPDYPQEEIRRVRQKYRLPEQYFLYLGTLEPRKNLPRLMEAYSRLRQRLENAPALVLAGRKGWMYDSIFETVKKLNLEEQGLFTDYVPEEEGPYLLGGALAFVFPSLYEGFGMPPLEAMACGTPVLTSNTSALPEVVGEGGILADPFSVEELAEGLYRLAVQEALRQELAVKGREQARKYTWEKAAEKLYGIYEELAGEQTA